jgi:hypothetical protein
VSQSAKQASSSRSGSSKSPAKARRVLVAQRGPDGWHLLVAEAASPDGRKARVLDTAPGGADPAGAVSELIEKHRPDATIGVLTAGEAVCRVVEIPEGHDAELSEAASLLAEAELPPSIADHRKAGGVVPLAAGAGFRAALLIGWPERGQSVDRPVPWVSWSSEVVGLSELLLLARVGGATGPRVVGSLDRAHGCIGVVGSGADGHALRTVLEDASEPESFAAAADRCLQGAGQKVNASSVPVAHISRSLLIEPEVRSAIAAAVAGVRDDDEWFAFYGVALGVACGALRSGLASGRLFDIRSTPPTVRKALPERVLLALQRPAVAGTVLAAGLALALLLPLGFSYARLSMLDSQVAAAKAALERTEALSDADPDLTPMSFQQRIAMYQALERNRWPMTKLLADIAAILPAESPDDLSLVRRLSIVYPDDFSLEGMADSVSLVNRASDAFRNSAVFSNAGVTRYTQIDGAGQAVEFEASGEVLRPFFVDPELVDYSQRNLAERIFEAEDTEIWRAGAPIITALTRSETASSRTPSRASRGTSTVANRTTPRAASGSSGGSGDGATQVASGGTEESNARTERREMFQGGSRSGGEEEAKPIPDPLTDEQIAQLNQQEAMREMVNRRSAARQDNVSDEVKRRLDDEVTKLRNRAREAQQGGA